MEKKNYESPDVEVIEIADDVIMAAPSVQAKEFDGNGVGTTDANFDEEEE